MSESTTREQTLEEVVDRVQRRAHERFRYQPRTEEHGWAIEAEIDADRDLHDEVQRRRS